MTDLRGRDRLIVALDVPTHDRALALVDTLDNVSLFKVGLELLLAGDLFAFLGSLQERRPRGGIFLDLKIAGDIGNTIASLIRQIQRFNVRFFTLVESVPLAMTLNSVKAARAARGDADDPKLLMVPFLSSMDQADLRASGIDKDVDSYIVERAKIMIDAGCDGLIVSGNAIQLCRTNFPSAVLVSPGIRPEWATADDQKRTTTPGEAVAFGTDYLVVGRPITRAASPRDAAQRIIDEVDSAVEEHSARSRAVP